MECVLLVDWEAGLLQGVHQGPLGNSLAMKSQSYRTRIYDALCRVPKHQQYPKHQ